MNKLLLTTALVAVAGVAAAEITVSGSAGILWHSHNQDTAAENASGENGLSTEADIDLKGTAELDNGITASINYGLGIDYAIEEGGSSALTLDDFPTITLESSMATLTVGDVETSYVSAFGDDMLKEVDGELVADIDTTVGPAAVGVSYVIDGSYGSTDDGRTPISTDTYTVTAAGNVSGIKGAVGIAGDATPVVSTDNGFGADMGPLIGVMGGYELNGIDVALKFQTQADRLQADGVTQADTSLIGLDLGYTMTNGVSLGASIDSTTIGDADATIGYEVSAGFEAMGADVTVSYGDDNTDDDVDGTFAIDAAYEVLPGLTVLAGYDMGEANAWGIDPEDGAGYIATSYDLGGGASIYASYADYADAGDAEYDLGGTLGLALSF